MLAPVPQIKIAAVGAVAAALIGVAAGVWAKPGPATAHPLLGPRQEMHAAGIDAPAPLPTLPSNA
jgi:hypothetical protein